MKRGSCFIATGPGRQGWSLGSRMGLGESGVCGMGIGQPYGDELLPGVQVPIF